MWTWHFSSNTLILSHLNSFTESCEHKKEKKGCLWGMKYKPLISSRYQKVMGRSWNWRTWLFLGTKPGTRPSCLPMNPQITVNYRQLDCKPKSQKEGKVYILCPIKEACTTKITLGSVCAVVFFFLGNKIKVDIHDIEQIN